MNPTPGMIAAREAMMRENGESVDVGDRLKQRAELDRLHQEILDKAAELAITPERG